VGSALPPDGPGLSATATAAIATTALSATSAYTAIESADTRRSAARSARRSSGASDADSPARAPARSGDGREAAPAGARRGSIGLGSTGLGDPPPAARLAAVRASSANAVVLAPPAADRATSAGGACPGSTRTGASPSVCRSSGDGNTAPHRAHEYASAPVSALHA